MASLLKLSKRFAILETHKDLEGYIWQLEQDQECVE